MKKGLDNRNMITYIVTRHPGLVDYIRELGIATESDRGLGSIKLEPEGEQK